MLGLGVAVLWSGYTLFAWGIALLGHKRLPTGHTPSFLDLAWPGKWASGKSNRKAQNK